MIKWCATTLNHCCSIERILNLHGRRQDPDIKGKQRWGHRAGHKGAIVIRQSYIAVQQTFPLVGTTHNEYLQRDRTMATSVHMHRKFGEVRPCGF